MLVLLKVGEYLTYRYTTNLDALVNEFLEFMPEVEVLLTRDDGFCYFEILPKLIDPKYIYKSGWYYNVPEVVSVFKDYKKDPGSYFKLELISEIKKYLKSILVGVGSRICELYEQDLNSLGIYNDSELPDIVSPGTKVIIHVNYFKSFAFILGDGIIVDIINVNSPYGIDPLLEEARGIKKIIEMQRSYSEQDRPGRFLISAFFSLLEESGNPYLIIDRENWKVYINEEKEKEFLSQYEYLKKNILELGKKKKIN